MRVPLRETSTCENRLCRNRLLGPIGESDFGAIGPSYLGFYVEHRVCKVDIVFPAGTDIEFDRRTVGHGRQRMILDPTTMLHAGLSRRNEEQIQFRLCTFARLFVNESHYYENTSRIFLFFLLVFTRRTPDPD